MKPNTHITHFEDSVLFGRKATAAAINLLKDVVFPIQPQTKWSVKWDGSPSIIYGNVPGMRGPFISTKSLFNKQPKLYFTPDQIREGESDQTKAEKLVLLFDILSRSKVPFVIQGDVLWFDDKVRNADNFRPNIIKYESDKTLGQYQAGIAFHTMYTCYVDEQTDELVVQDVKYNAQDFIHTTCTFTDVWVPNPLVFFDDVSQQDHSVLEKLTFIAEQASNDIETYSSLFIEQLKQFINTSYNPYAEIAYIKNQKGFIDFLYDQKRKAVDSVKTEKAKDRHRTKFNNWISFVKTYETNINALFLVHEVLTAAKQVIINNVQTDDTLRKTIEVVANADKLSMYKIAGIYDEFREDVVETYDVGHEGYVAVIDNHVFKFVDRDTFSHFNFHQNTVRGWSS